MGVSLLVLQPTCSTGHLFDTLEQQGHILEQPHFLAVFFHLSSFKRRVFLSNNWALKSQLFDKIPVVRHFVELLGLKGPSCSTLKKMGAQLF